MDQAPLISVVTPARNAEATLAQTLDSLLAQSLGDWECIIVNDGSTDATAAIIEAYRARDSRFRAVLGAGQGVCAARNLGIAAARGKWLHFLDADDWNDPAFYRKLVQAAAAMPDAVAVYSEFLRAMPGGVMAEIARLPANPENPFEDFARGCLVAMGAVLVDRELVLRLGAFDTSLRVCEDWDLWQRVARLGGSWAVVKEKLAFYRTAGPSLSARVDWMNEDGRKVIERGFGVDQRLAGLPLAHAGGASPALGSRAQALAYYSLWTLGMDCGAGGAGRVDPGMLTGYGDAATQAYAISTILFEGLLVGLRALPAQVAARWPEFGDRLTGAIAWLGQVWDDAGAARAIQYHLEERLLYSETFTAGRRFCLTQSVQVDLADPPETILLPGVDRLYANFVEEGRDRRVTLAALGNFTRAQWPLVRGVDRHMTFRRWRAAQGPKVDRLWLRRAAAVLLRQPKLLLDRSKLRAALQPAWQAARLAQLGRLDPPGSHEKNLQAVMAAAQAAARADRPAKAVRTTQLAEAAAEAGKQDYFETLFEQEDPWRYGSPYEQQKYQRQLALLPEGVIGRALEIGCAEGHFTAQLAPRVTQLLAADISGTALARAQARCAEYGNIDFQKLDLSAQPVPGDLDLVVCSEVLYYLSGEAELRQVARNIAQALRPGGCVVMANGYLLKDNPARTGFDWDTIYGAEVIHRVFRETEGLRLERSIETELYRIDRFRRVVPDQPDPPPVIETLPVVAALEREMARHIVWGGAKRLRRDVAMHERHALVPVLHYREVSQDGRAVSPAMFKAQLRWLRANGYHAVGSAQLAAQVARGEPFAGRPVMLSFDQDVQAFEQYAWPLLLAHDFTAECFVATGRVAPGDAGAIARLAAEGVLFGSRLVTDRPVDGRSSLELAQELAGSREMLGRWLGEQPLGFAAPFGITDNRLGGLAAQTGYQIGFGASTGAAMRLDADPLNLPRIAVEREWTLAQFIHCLESWL